MTVVAAESISNGDAMAALERARSRAAGTLFDTVRWLAQAAARAKASEAEMNQQRIDAEQEIAAIDRALELLRRAP